MPFANMPSPFRKFRIRRLIEAAFLTALPFHLHAQETSPTVESTPAGGISISSDIAAYVDDGISSPKPAAKKAIPPSRDIRVQLPGFSHHFSEPAAARYGKKWNEQNYGIGIEFRDPIGRPDWDGWSTLESAGLMKDSLGAWGGYAGMALQKRFVDDGEYTLDFGPSFWLMWRTFDFGGPHLLVPAVLPSLSAEDKSSGWGVNSILIPGFRWKNREMPTVLWIGITKSY